MYVKVYPQFPDVKPPIKGPTANPIPMNVAYAPTAPPFLGEPAKSAIYANPIGKTAQIPKPQSIDNGTNCRGSNTTTSEMEATRNETKPTIMTGFLPTLSDQNPTRGPAMIDNMLRTETKMPIKATDARRDVA